MCTAESAELKMYKKFKNLIISSSDGMISYEKESFSEEAMRNLYNTTNIRTPTEEFTAGTILMVSKGNSNYSVVFTNIENEIIESLLYHFKEGYTFDDIK